MGTIHHQQARVPVMEIRDEINEPAFNKRLYNQCVSQRFCSTAVIFVASCVDAFRSLVCWIDLARRWRSSVHRVSAGWRGRCQQNPYISRRYTTFGKMGHLSASRIDGTTRTPHFGADTYDYWSLTDAVKPRQATCDVACRHGAPLVFGGASPKGHSQSSAQLVILLQVGF